MSSPELVVPLWLLATVSVVKCSEGVRYLMVSQFTYSECHWTHSYRRDLATQSSVFSSLAGRSGKDACW